MTESAHSKTAEALCAHYEVDPKSGISEADAARPLARYGPNALRAHRSRSAWDILRTQFRSLIVILLGAAAAISLAFGEIPEAVAIIAVIAINGAIGFFTELKAVRSMEALRRIGSVLATVRRDGSRRQVDARDLVPGDIVLLEGGEVISADLRLLEARDLQCDESTLTGESLPVPKDTVPLGEQTPLADRRNMGFRGTAVTRGDGTGLVVATGMATELGRISELVEGAEREETSLERRLDQLGSQLVRVTLVLVGMIALSGILTGRPLLEMIQTAIALAVAAVPEGLPIVATLALARGMWRMAERNALIENLAAVETLGATTIVFTDKTGTLTENRMTVVRLALASGTVTVGDGSAPFAIDAAAVTPDEYPALRVALEICVLCNTAQLPDNGDPEGEKAFGDPMELALLAAGQKAGMTQESLGHDYPEVEEYPFDPDRQMMATAHRVDGADFVAVKGSPPAVLECATRLLDGDDVRELTDADRAAWLERNAVLAGQGLRLLALAYGDDAVRRGDPYRDLILVGLCGLEDPARQDVPEAIAACYRAGIDIVMVTGDQAVTARSIAEGVGFRNGSQLEVTEARDLKPISEMNEEERQATLRSRIFARVSPEQKLDLVDLHQEAGQVVAMTGDGVNDAPALRKADIGIAMGRRGTQVAREAADMVLRDDAFPTIVSAMAQGRIIFGNIRKFVLYLLSCNLSEILIVWLGAVSGLPLPLLPLQILFLNLVTDVFPALALGTGEGDRNVMRQPPRDPAEAMVTRMHWLLIVGFGMLITAATLGAFGIGLFVFGHDAREAVTMSFLTLALAQLWHVFNVADLSSHPLVNEVSRNRWVWGALLLCSALVLAAVYLPGLSEVLRLSQPDGRDWLVILGLSLAPLAVVRIGHALLRPRHLRAAKRR